MTLYAKRDATDQLRRINGVSVTRLERERMEDIYCVTAYATDNTGRTDSSIGAVSIGNLRGEALANAMMKAETKAKRRVTLSLCGLGWLDETEIETIPDAKPAPVEVINATVVVPAPMTAAAKAEAPAPGWEDLQTAQEERAAVVTSNGIPDPATMKSQAQLVAWAMTTGVFDHHNHALNAWDVVKREAKPRTFEQLRELWIADVRHRVAAKQAQPELLTQETKP